MSPAVPALLSVCLSAATAADQWDVERQGTYRQVREVILLPWSFRTTLLRRFEVPYTGWWHVLNRSYPRWILAWASFSSLTLEALHTHPVS